MPGDRKSIRLREYDYSTAGAYHITICTANKRKIFRNGKELSVFGKIAEDNFKYIEEKFCIDIQVFSIMPDHIHILINNFYTNHDEGREKITNIIGAYKSKVQNDCLIYCKKNGIILGKLWQRSFYDHIILYQNFHYYSF